MTPSIIPKSTAEITVDQTYDLFLFVGPADSGKSYAATSFGLMSKAYGGDDPRDAYVIECDGRLNALRGRPVKYNNFTNEDGAVGVLNVTGRLRESCIASGRSPFHTVILDSFTAFNDFSIADSHDVTEQGNKKDPKNKKGRIRGELQMLTTEDYGYEAEAVRQLLWEDLLDLKKYCNVIVVAHEAMSYRTVKGAPGEPTKTEPDGYKILCHGNKIAARMPTKFDEIYHFLPKEEIISTKTIRRSVKFQDQIARSSYPTLAKSTETYDITDKEFYLFWKELKEKK